jgi:signal transduction histidine kinase
MNEKYGTLTEKQHEFSKDAYDGTVRLVDLISDLLNISRIESGRLQIDPTPTNILELVQSVYEEVQIDATAKKQNIQISIDENVPLINLDPKLIRNVYLNYLTNAIKYTPPEGVITVGAYIDETYLYSYVKDNGLGIPEDSKEQIFGRFYRANNVRKMVPDGTGLGLYLVKVVVESSDGKAWFESEEGKGSTFWFKIPVAGVTPRKGEVALQ